MEDLVAPTHPVRRHRRHHHYHRRGRGRSRIPVPAYARIAIPILVVLLLAWLVWQGARSLLNSGPSPSSANTASAQEGSATAPWVHDFTDSLDASARDAAAGNLSAAEIDADRAESFVTLAQLDSRLPPADFFASASDQIDRVLHYESKDPVLLEHLTSARIALAEFRSSQEIASPAPARGRIFIETPREIAANQTLDPSTLKGNYLDATPLPEVSEILTPPTSRALADSIRVENLTIAGAAQTLDGIWWRNVTFVGTHLRYEGGELSLENVRFVRCRFGLPTDPRGALIANTIALAPPPGSVTIQAPAP